MELRKIIGLRIKTLREVNGMSQKDLAEKLNTTQATIARFETGISCPNEDLLYEISLIFDVSLDWLFNRSDKRNGEGLSKKYLMDQKKKQEKKVVTGINALDLKALVEQYCKEYNEKNKEK